MRQHMAAHIKAIRTRMTAVDGEIEVTITAHEAIMRDRDRPMYLWGIVTAVRFFSPRYMKIPCGSPSW
jgi:hypothetical protein